MSDPKSAVPNLQFGRRLRKQNITSESGCLFLIMSVLTNEGL
ncbi:Uncharacterized protein dnm_086340 [Desulfonema magnum]|uniref:Uncharacterized protein n=1 Tax=Desulfonema magnum TaxID=45655 RepID=A0A975BVK3_9BACT|nr:Uncharacterized protein dnm_086340 [Desulfonema magnum]